MGCREHPKILLGVCGPADGVPPCSHSLGPRPGSAGVGRTLTGSTCPAPPGCPLAARPAWLLPTVDTGLSAGHAQVASERRRRALTAGRLPAREPASSQRGKTTRAVTQPGRPALVTVPHQLLPSYPHVHPPREDRGLSLCPGAQSRPGTRESHRLQRPPRPDSLIPGVLAGEETRPLGRGEAWVSAPLAPPLCGSWCPGCSQAPRTA